MYIKIMASMDRWYHTIQCVQKKCLIHTTAGFWELSLSQTFLLQFCHWCLASGNTLSSIWSGSDLLIFYFKTGGFKTDSYH